MLKCFTFFSVLLLGCLLTSWTNAASEKATEAQINSLKKSISELTRTLNQVKGERNSVQTELQRTDKKIGALARDIMILNDQLVGSEAKLRLLKQQREPLLLSLREQAGDLEKQLRQQYKAGNLPRLQLLLTQRDPEQLSRMMTYYDRINQQLAERLRVFKEDLDKLELAELYIRSTQQEVFDHRDSLKQRSDSLEQVRKERRTVLASLEEQLKSDGSKLKSLKVDQTRLEKLLVQIRSSIAKISLKGADRTFRELKGRMPWPAKGSLARRYGNRQGGIAYDGILLSSSSGRAVKAIHHGRVVFSDWFKGFGLLTIVDHGDGYMSLYGHNETLLTEVGEWVAAGDQLATIGNSGGSTKPGLYFAVRYNGKPTDPLKWLARR